jgi:hypothetical protein
MIANGIGGFDGDTSETLTDAMNLVLELIYDA